jgi:hypothetical protein
MVAGYFDKGFCLVGREMFRKLWVSGGVFGGTV